MTSDLAKRLKKQFSECPAECFEPLVFGELAVGDKFIGLPIPGDNHGHGGFRSGSHVFMKTVPFYAGIMSAMAGKLENAINISRGVPYDCPNNMPVIKVI